MIEVQNKRFAKKDGTSSVPCLLPPLEEKTSVYSVSLW